MADNTVSNRASIVKENSPINLDFLNGNTPVVSSLHISQHFNKKHKHVLRDIQDLRSNFPKSFVESNFEPMFYSPQGGPAAFTYGYVARPAGGGPCLTIIFSLARSKGIACTNSTA